jgi:hypothetical protein
VANDGSSRLASSREDRERVDAEVERLVVFVSKRCTFPRCTRDVICSSTQLAFAESRSRYAVTSTYSSYSRNKARDGYSHSRGSPLRVIALLLSARSTPNRRSARGGSARFRRAVPSPRGTSGASSTLVPIIRRAADCSSGDNVRVLCKENYSCNYRNVCYLHRNLFHYRL